MSSDGYACLGTYLPRCLVFSSRGSVHAYLATMLQMWSADGETASLHFGSAVSRTKTVLGGMGIDMAMGRGPGWTGKRACACLIGARDECQGRRNSWFVALLPSVAELGHLAVRGMALQAGLEFSLPRVDLDPPSNQTLTPPGPLGEWKLRFRNG
jgi:hypothetical protein